MNNWVKLSLKLLEFSFKLEFTPFGMCLWPLCIGFYLKFSLKYSGTELHPDPGKLSQCPLCQFYYSLSLKL